MSILIATANKDKIKEIQQLMTGCKILSLLDFPEIPPVVEDGDTLIENAVKKAKTLALITGLPAIADDTGLFIDALNGAPGVHSAYYAGSECSYEANRKKVLDVMKSKQERNARFITSMVMVFPDGKIISAEGILEGLITKEEIGSEGFGYDSVFFVPSQDKTLAQLKLSQKNEISHRGLALRALIKKLHDADVL